MNHKFIFKLLKHLCWSRENNPNFFFIFLKYNLTVIGSSITLTAVILCNESLDVLNKIATVYIIGLLNLKIKNIIMVP